MSEKINSGEPTRAFRRAAYISERAGIKSIPSEELLRRQLQSQRSRAALIEGLRQARAAKAAELGTASIDVIQGKSNAEGQEVDNQDKLVSVEVILPIDLRKQEIIDMVKEHRASVVVSETGGGKSTQLPHMMLEAGCDHVFVVQGRRGMTDGLSDRIQSELNAKLGAEKATGMVNSIHGGRTRKYENANITVGTAASLTFMLEEIEREFGDKSIGWILDEIHEDDPHVELAVGAVGMASATHPKWRVVAASATIDPEPLKIPLGRITNFDNPESVEVPVMYIEGRPHALEVYQDATMNPVECYFANGEGHQISMLATRGFGQIERMKQELLSGYIDSYGNSDELIIRSYTGKTSTYQREELANLAANLTEGKRLVVLATPAARSGITIPGLTFVAIDGMINREKREEDRSRGIETEYMSRAELIQFMGRSGRDVGGGVAWLTKPMPGREREDALKAYAKVYPFQSIEARDEYPLPAIFNSNLAELILNGASAGKLPSVLNKFIINEQDESNLGRAVDRLRKEFGALDDDHKITATGRLMSRFPVAPELSRGLAEAVLQGRSREQLARMAFVAASIDVGGLQSTRKNADKAEWKEFIRSGSDDDFLAQVDFHLALQELERSGASYRDVRLYAYLHDLDHSRVASSQEPTEKILRRLGLRPDQVQLEPPSFKEIKEMRDDFTAGMYDLTFRHSRRKNDDVDYFDPVRSTGMRVERTLAKQSVLEPRKGDIIAGMPQFFPTIRNGEVRRVNILGATLRVDPAVVARHALTSSLVEYVHIPGSERMDGGLVVESEQAMFGDMRVGGHRTVKGGGDVIPLDSQRKLVERVQTKPGDELATLRSVATELAEYRRIIPKEIIEQYRRPDAPTDLTLNDITTILNHYAARTRSPQELDRLVGNHAYNNNLLIDMYYDSAARREMLQRSPATIEIAGVEVQIQYDNGRPYVPANRIPKDRLATITGPVYIDEGFENRREVLVQVPKEGGRGVRRVSFGPLEA